MTYNIILLVVVYALHTKVFLMSYIGKFGEHEGMNSICSHWFSPNYSIILL